MVAKLTEQLIQKSCLDYLKLKGIYCYKINNGGVHKPSGGFIPAQTRGLPDVVMHRNGKVEYIEMKTPTGRMSEYQIAFGKRCLDEGIPYWVIHSLDELREVVES